MQTRSPFATPSFFKPFANFWTSRYSSPVGVDPLLVGVFALPDQCHLVAPVAQHVPVEAVVRDVGLAVDEPFCVRVVPLAHFIIGGEPVEFLGDMVPEFVRVLDKLVVGPGVIPHPAVHAVGRVRRVISGFFAGICALVHNVPLIYIINNDESKLIFTVRIRKIVQIIVRLPYIAHCLQFSTFK